MLSAIRNSDSKKVIGHMIEKNSNENYYCEKCSEELIHHKSKSGIRIGHFKHRKSDCSNYKPMSFEHLEIQFQIFEHISENYKSVKSIETEKWLGDNSIRADVYIETKKGTKIGIEVQSSSISFDEISRRTQSYARNNIYVFWIIPYDDSRFIDIDEDDEYNFNKKIKLKAYERFLYWSNVKALYLWDLDGKGGSGFIKMVLSNYCVPQDDYYDENGNIQSAPDRVTKTFKMIDDIIEVEFSDFQPKVIGEFTPKKIPLRKILIT